MNLSERENHYLENGYKLPEGWTWEKVYAERKRTNTGEIYVPIRVLLSIVVWGVPLNCIAKRGIA